MQQRYYDPLIGAFLSTDPDARGNRFPCPQGGNWTNAINQPGWQSDRRSIYRR
jgi:hypothetical protein